MDIKPLGSQPVSFEHKAIPALIAGESAPAKRTSQNNETASAEKVAKPGESAKTTAEKLSEQNAKLEDIVDSANKNLGLLSNTLVFNLNRDIDRVVVQLVDISSKEVIRQYPSEEMVEIYTALKKLSDLLLPNAAGSMGTDDSVSGMLLKTLA